MRPAAYLTLDVEDWDHANYRQLRGRETEIRRLHKHALYPMEKNVDAWIELTQEFKIASTCFVLGEFAQRYPVAVRRLAAAGHEIACHGLTHDLIYEMTPSQFGEYLKKSIGVLGEITGKKPIGFRAPSWSVRPEMHWFFEELSKQGIRYDSSLFPVRTPLFGAGQAPLKTHIEQGVARIPVNVLAVEALGLRMPFSSGAFFRLCPTGWIIRGLQRAARQGQNPMIVLHPRELDPHHPRLPLRGWEAWVHYCFLKKTVPKLRSVLGATHDSFEWKTLQDALQS